MLFKKFNRRRLSLILSVIIILTICLNLLAIFKDNLINRLKTPILDYKLSILKAKNRASFYLKETFLKEDNNNNTILLRDKQNQKRLFSILLRQRS